MDRHEDIYLEVERRLETLKTSGVKTVSRDLKIVQEVDTYKMPALYLTGGSWEDYEAYGGRRKRVLWVSVHCFVNVFEDSSPLTDINKITKEILDLFKPDTNGGIVCNLGGLCDNFIPIRALASEGRANKNKASVVIDFNAEFMVGNC